MTDLFSFASGNLQVAAPYQPLADRMRPDSIEDILGQEHILGQGKPLRMLLQAGLSGSIILWGPPGCGKTTLARVMARHSDAEFIQLSAVTSGVKDLKAAFDRAAESRRLSGRKTMLFVDEIHRFNKAQQDAFASYRIWSISLSAQLPKTRVLRSFRLYCHVARCLFSNRSQPQRC